MKKISDGMIMQSLDWAYDKAVCGVSVADSASEMAESYVKENDTARDCVNASTGGTFGSVATNAIGNIAKLKLVGYFNGGNDACT